MRAVIFVNGVVQDSSALARRLRASDHLIAADGGTRHCLALGRRPHAIVGDLDSLDPALVAEMERVGVLIERHPAAKDKTDLELAIEYAIRQGATAILLLGALGGRLDQSLANVLLLARAEWPIPITLAEGDEEAQIVREGEEVTLSAPVGGAVSVLALTAQVTGITYRGLEYPLDDFTLPLGSTRGVSNVVATQPATIRVGEGVLLVVQQIDEAEPDSR
ncbi:MAG: thiamine diphosphokinase [Caldilineaceae bacterium]|nr:thiamine diphosphokinase [Caldilineaceae bacterium]